MTKKWLWLTIGAVAVGTFVAGLVVAQEGLLYPYLPDVYSERYIPTLAEWRALDLTAHWNYEGGLTERLIRTSLEASALDRDLVLLVGTKPQPNWPVYSNGRFTCSDREVRAAYQEAADSLGSPCIMATVRNHFPGIADKDVQIQFFIDGGEVGTWQGGKMTLEGEE